VGDLSTHFSRSEFKCGCCNFDTVDARLLVVLEVVRVKFGAPVSITSRGGCRCMVENRLAGGALNSQHLYGRGADFVVKGVSAHLVQRFLKQRYADSLGIGSAESYTHVDSRTDGPARWSYP